MTELLHDTQVNVMLPADPGLSGFCLKGCSAQFQGYCVYSWPLTGQYCTSVQPYNAFEIPLVLYEYFVLLKEVTGLLDQQDKGFSTYPAGKQSAFQTRGAIDIAHFWAPFRKHSDLLPESVEDKVTSLFKQCLGWVQHFMIKLGGASVRTWVLTRPRRSARSPHWSASAQAVWRGPLPGRLGQPA